MLMSLATPRVRSTSSCFVDVNAASKMYRPEKMKGLVDLSNRERKKVSVRRSSGAAGFQTCKRQIQLKLFNITRISEVSTWLHYWRQSTRSNRTVWILISFTLRCYFVLQKNHRTWRATQSCQQQQKKSWNSRTRSEYGKVGNNFIAKGYETLTIVGIIGHQ